MAYQLRIKTNNSEENEINNWTTINELGLNSLAIKNHTINTTTINGKDVLNTDGLALKTLYLRNADTNKYYPLTIGTDGQLTISGIDLQTTLFEIGTDDPSENKDNHNPKNFYIREMEKNDNTYYIMYFYNENEENWIPLNAIWGE